MKLHLFSLLLIGLFMVGSCKKSYRGYTVVKAYSLDPKNLLFLEELAEENKINILGSGPSEGWPASTGFYFAPSDILEIKARLQERKIYYVVTSDDMQREIDEETRLNDEARAKSSHAVDDTWHLSYHPYSEILGFLDQQVANCGDQCSVIEIGTSYQGLPLRVVKLTGAPNECSQKPAIWIDAGIHAREWISHSTIQYILDNLISGYDTDPVIRNLRDTYDWYIYSTVNPDGYTYSWASDRMWRKSRRPTAGSTCLGADVNRNYDFMWMTVGASNNPCSETFAGATPYSEPEALAMANFVSTLTGSWHLFWTLHTYGQLYMSPWGYTNALPANYPALERVGRAAIQTILENSGKVYTFGSSAAVLYQSSGTSRDWAKGVPEIPFVYTLELRDTGTFVLPPTEILPTGQEIWAALLTTVSFMQAELPPDCVNVKGQ